ncbi:hypothetical protein I907_gp55 [Bacillus phage Eoghan]|uniref:Uncharacterized protein n=2 Tax=Andromedavirus TaxID=1623275 RepID=M1HN54_9CAUD|nr:hypothetical protein I907_gp55 [Bacillus phage Eoghan]YP_009592288.1 hypothetical protein FDG68_gp55 [Bacillus phage Taylor]AGE60819.1 hypothetical protein EOGHAN_56 [Bacillus phage Eoghan]AGE60973.1 hypothetical protein TAYLOR_55 [Bacillus phage Taylor]
MKLVIKQGQLSESDEQFLHRWFRQKHPLEYTFKKHARYRLKQRKISREAFWEAFTGSVQIVKFTITDKGEPRLLMRSTKKFKGKRIVAAFSPSKGVVNTVYYISDIPDPKGKPIQYNIEGYIKKYERRVKQNEQKTKNPA